MSAGLDVRVSLTRGGFTLRVELDARPGEIIAVVGRNGSGKSTLLGTIAGLVTPQEGEIAVTRGGERTVLTRTGPARDGRSRAGLPGTRLVPPARRRLGLLGQEPLLFPHLTARQNVAYGLLAQGATHTQARARAQQWLEAVRLGPFALRRPAALSGGQQQRVALARALAPGPDVLLLDEPMAALDVEAAARVRALLAERVRATGTTTLLVSHDVRDVLLADRVLVLDDGHVSARGRPGEVLARPETPFLRRLAGGGLVAATVRADGSVLIPPGRGTGRPAGGAGRPAPAGAVPGATVWVSIIPDPRGGPADDEDA